MFNLTYLFNLQGCSMSSSLNSAARRLAEALILYPHNDLKPSDFLILMRLATTADEQGTCQLSLRQLAKKTGMHFSTICAITRRLKAKGFIEIFKRTKQTGGLANGYLFTSKITGAVNA